MPQTTPIALREDQLATVTFDADGLVPAIIQEAGTGQVLMMAWMDDEAVRRTLTTGRTVSPSPGALIRGRTVRSSTVTAGIRSTLLGRFVVRHNTG